MDTCYEKGRIIDAECSYDNGKFVFECLPACLPPRCTVRFRAPADYAGADKVCVQGKDLLAMTPGMENAPDGIFKAGAIVSCDIDLDRAMVFFTPGGSLVGGGGATQPNLSYEEQYAGYDDEDGHKVYMKTVEFGSLPNAGTKRVPHGIANLRSLVNLLAYWTLPGTEYFVGDHINEVTFMAGPIDIIGYAIRDRTSYSAIVRLYYTCTDR